MMFIGIFYVLGAVLVPAYLHTKTTTIPALAVDMGATLASFMVLSIFIAAGFVLHSAEEQ